MRSFGCALVAFVGLLCSHSALYGNPTPVAGSAVNFSVRVELHSKPAIQGLVVDGVRVVLIRAIGPGLVPFGVEDVVPDPTIAVVDQHGNVLGRSIPMRELSGQQFALISQAFADCGAFPVPRSSTDAVLLLPISGIVTARVESAAFESGEVLVEAYILPWTEFDRSTRVSK